MKYLKLRHFPCRWSPCVGGFWNFFRLQQSVDHLLITNVFSDDSQSLNFTAPHHNPRYPTPDFPFLDHEARGNMFPLPSVAWARLGSARLGDARLGWARLAQLRLAAARPGLGRLVLAGLCSLPLILAWLRKLGSVGRVAVRFMIISCRWM